jgi:transcription-repair coupling factor (superfamily II helicase)
MGGGGAGPEEAEQAAADLEALLGEGAVHLYPQRESLPYEEGEPHLEIGGLRVEALEALLSGRASMLVTTPRAVQELSRPSMGCDDLRLELARASGCGPRSWPSGWRRWAFERVATVEEVGQYALRGGILDVFGFGSPEPVRIEFWGDEIESIRHFDILTQLSVARSTRCRCCRWTCAPLRAPSAGAPRPLRAIARSLLDYLPPDATSWCTWTRRGIASEWERTWTEVQRLHEAGPRPARRAGGAGAALPASPSGGAALEGFARLLVVDRGERPSRRAPRRLRPVLRPSRSTATCRASARCCWRGSARRATLILCDNEGQLERLQELLDELGVRERRQLAIGSLTGGFVLADAAPPLRVLTDHEIFRRTRRSGAVASSAAAWRSRASPRSSRATTWSTWTTGSASSADGAGAGRRGGLRDAGHRVRGRRAAAGAGAPGRPDRALGLRQRRRAAPRVHKIGGKDWKPHQAEDPEGHRGDDRRAAGALRGARGSRGFAYSPDTRWQREMESAFLFEDTPDQRQATEDVKRDMESPRPMDRLICGDVGYGKTEVAIRAAFKAVQDGKQVAVLVPTTILAEQHLHTFAERLADFPVRIEALSRFRTAKEQREVLARLSAARSTSSSARTACSRRTSSSRTWASWWWTRSSASA